MASRTVVLSVRRKGMRTFIRRMRSVLPHRTTCPSMMPFMPPPGMTSKPSMFREGESVSRMSSPKHPAEQQPEASIIEPA